MFLLSSPHISPGSSRFSDAEEGRTDRRLHFSEEQIRGRGRSDTVEKEGESEVLSQDFPWVEEGGGEVILPFFSSRSNRGKKFSGGVSAATLIKAKVGSGVGVQRRAAAAAAIIFIRAAGDREAE